MSKKWMILCFSLVLLAAVFSGCAADDPAVEAPPNKGQEAQEEKAADIPQILTAGLGRDPGEQYGYGAHPPLTRVLEPLVFRDPEKGLIPGLATGWETSEDSLTWTLHLREGVVFHDGTPFNAEAVVHNIWRIANMSPGRFGALEEVEATTGLEVRVIHSEPFASFLYALAWPGSAMISPEAVEEDGAVLEPIGTGPFMREDWQPGQEMTLVKNDLYWGGPPHLEKVILKFIPDPTTRMIALEAEEIDMIIDTGGVLPEQVATLEPNPEVEVLTVDGAVPHYMSLNTREWPLDDLQVRRAVMYAIDLDSIVQHVLEGYGRVMHSVIPYSEREWLHPDELFSYNNPDRPRELLEQAGWQVGGDGVLQKDGRRLELKFALASSLVGRWPYQTIAEIMQAQLGEVGMDVEIEVMEAGLWRETLQKGEANLSIRPWSAICPQSRLNSWLHSEGDQNLAMGIFYANTEMDRLTEELLCTVDEDAAVDLAYQIQELAAREVPLIPLYDEILINAVRTNVKGYQIDPKFNVNYEDIYLVE